MIKQQVINWMNNEFGNSLVHRTDFYCILLNYILSRNVKTIVETGTSRDNSIEGVAGDGCSTLIFSKFLAEFIPEGMLYTVDIDPEAIKKSQEIIGKADNVVFYTMDSLQFLAMPHAFKIDLLYLDSFDAKMTQAESIPAAQHQLKEIKAIEDRLLPDTVIALDDSYLKGFLSIPYLISKQWKTTYHSPVKEYVIKDHKFYNFGNTILVRNSNENYI